jgi:hypothetical protein
MPKSVRRRGSLWPPVGPIAAPAMNRRGSGNVGLFHGGLQAPVGAAGVAHGREAAVDHAEHQPRGACRHQRQRHGFEVADVHLAQRDMDMAVDQARHQGTPAAIDHVGALRLDRLVGNLNDGIALDQQFVARLQRADLRFEQLKITE